MHVSEHCFGKYFIVNIHRTPAISKPSLWTSKIQTTTSAKIIFTTRLKKLNTTDADTPTAKTGKVINTRRMYGFIFF